MEGNITNLFVKRAGDNWWMNSVQANFDESVPHLQPGIYKIDVIGQGTITYAGVAVKDELVHFKEGVVGEILSRTSSFFSEKTTKAYADLKVAQQIGILLHGPHGTGKSCTVLVAMQQMVAQYGAVCLDCTDLNTQWLLKAVKEIRTNNPNVPLVIFVDEFDYAIGRNEGAWLTILDGTDSINRSVFIGCTNYLNKIPTRIKDRKSRVKFLFEVNRLPHSVYLDFVTRKLPNHMKDIWQQFAYLAGENHLSLDELKHAVIDYYVDDTPIAEACKAAIKEPKLVGSTDMDLDEEE